MLDFTKRLTIILCFLIVIWAPNVSGFRYFRIRWEGEVEVPVDKANFGMDNPAARWWGVAPEDGLLILMQSRLGHLVYFEFSDIGEGSEIKVYDARRMGSKKWKLRREFINVTSGRFETIKKRGIRIIANEKATFKLRYFRGICPVPYFITAKSCTNKKLKDSTCSFECRSPDFLPLSQTNMTVKCQSDRSWSESLDEACVPKADIEKKCLNVTAEKGICPLSSEQLLAVYSEQKRADDTSRADLNFLGLTMRSRAEYAQYNWSLPQPSQRPGALPPARTISNDCFQFCIIDALTRNYKASCGSQPMSPTDLMTTCLMCRYVYDICSQNVVVA